MKPGLMMVIDPQPRRAADRVAGMLASWGGLRRVGVCAAQGQDWAAAAIAPPACLPGCGARIDTADGHILIWTGDIQLPDDWATHLDRKPIADPHAAISNVLLHRLRRHGVNTLAEIDGAFCGAWYDGDEHQWVIFNDRLGLLPLFWQVYEGRLIIAPNAWLAWQAGGAALHINTDGVTDVLRAANATEDHTLIDGVHWLRGGHALIWPANSRSTSDVSCCRYWEFRHQSPTAHCVQEAADEYVEAMSAAVRRQTAEDAPVLLGISGGMDSRLILAIAHHLGRVPHCFTVGWPFMEDVRFGRRLARVAGATHDFVTLHTHLLPGLIEQLIIESDGLHGARHLAAGSTVPLYLEDHAGAVLLEGHIHGILGGGCVPADDDINAGHPPHASKWAHKSGHAGADMNLLDSLLYADLARGSFERWAARIDERYRLAPSEDPLEKAEYAAFHGRSGRNDVLGPGFCRHHVLVRSPATCRAMLDWCARTPAAWRRGKQLYAEILNRRFPPLARVPRTDYSALPIAGDRWRKELCWQSDKVYRRWAKYRYPQVRKWGIGSAFITAWTFDTWRESGGLDPLLDPHARILAWVKKNVLHTLWHRATNDPAAMIPLLNLGTIETMIRWLDDLPALPIHSAIGRVQWRTIEGVARSKCDRAVRKTVGSLTE